MPTFPTETTIVEQWIDDAQAVGARHAVRVETTDLGHIHEVTLISRNADGEALSASAGRADETTDGVSWADVSADLQWVVPDAPHRYGGTTSLLSPRMPFREGRPLAQSVEFARRRPTNRRATLAAALWESRHCPECADRRDGSVCECYECHRCDARVESLCENCARCSDCCECAYCERCDNPVDGTCERCAQCENCCYCAYCRSCGDTVERTCDNDHCESCCDCSDDEEYAPRSPQFTPGEPHPSYPSRRMTSSEIEVEGMDRSEIMGLARGVGAAVVNDGSLQNGTEVCTPPASGDAAVRIVTRLTEAMVSAGAKITDRCGAHVHIDARDFTWADLRRLVTLWQALEDPHYRAQPKARRGSSYCRPCAQFYREGLTRHASPEKAVKDAVFRDPDHPTRSASKWGDQRYFALNVGSWFFRGTVEIRTHSGTVTAEKILHWQAYWATVLDFVKDATDEQIDALVAAADTPERKLALFLALAPSDTCRAHLQARIDKFA